MTIEGATVVAVYDIDETACRIIATQYDAMFMNSAEELIESPLVDAVVVASWDATHAELTYKCIKAGKPVFCEKPLATNLDDCEMVLDAELKTGRNLVQVGFMRRFDPDYRNMREIIKSGELGAPLMAHCVSRTPHVSSKHTTPMHVTNIVIHEIDLFRWILGEEIVEGQILFPRSTCFAAEGLKDPQLALMRSESGVLIDVEAAANSHYGYDIQCEIVCEKGTIRLPDPATPIIRTQAKCSFAVLDDWSKRFPVAYQSELQHWVDYLLDKSDRPGPGSWDGYATCAVTEALIRSQDSGITETVRLKDRQKPSRR